MNKMDSVNMTRIISDAPGAPGFEDAVVNAIRPYIADLGEVIEDKMRNLYCYRSGNAEGKPVVQLDAHTDEVAFIVQAIKPNGTLRFLPLGAWVEEAVAGHRVLVRNALGEYIPGIISTTPPHYTNDVGNGKTSMSNLAIDVGASSIEEAKNDFHIRIGEPVVPDVKFTYDEKHDLMIGKGFDCRLGCAAIIKTMRALKDEQLDVNVVGAWSCQEELGMRGANVTAKRVKPDIAIVFEGCPADDTCVEPYMVQTAIKKGPMLRFMDRLMLTHPRFQRYALDLGEKLGIPVQSGVRAGGSTNGSPIHLSGDIPCIVVGVPVRYIHTQYGIAAHADLENAAKLAAEIIKTLNADVLDTF